MKCQPNRDYVSDDRVFTPLPLARAIVDHFRPTGLCLDPARGGGAFLDYLPDGALWCEEDEGRPFLEFNEPVDWVITNPPWSKMRTFLQHGMRVSENVVYLMSLNHLWTKARQRDIREAGFHLVELALVEPYPAEFPSSGFQLGVAHLALGKQEDESAIAYSTIRWRPTAR